MTNSRLPRRILLSLLVLTLSGCGSRSVPEGTLITIVYSSDVRGRLDACGCRQGSGGVARRSAAIQTVRGENPLTVYCDAGNFLSGTAHADSSRGLVSVAAYDHMRASVVNVSERELAFGVEAYRASRRKSRFEWVSANLTYRGGALAGDFVIRKINDARVAFVGLCGATAAMRSDSVMLPAGTVIEDPVEAAREAVVAIGDKADLVVVLSTCGDAMDSLVARDVPGIDLIIGGRSFRSNSGNPWVVGETRIVRADHDGRTLGRMDIVFGAENKIATWRASTITMEDPNRADPEMLALVRRYIPESIENPAESPPPR